MNTIPDVEDVCPYPKIVRLPLMTARGGGTLLKKPFPGERELRLMPPEVSVVVTG